LGEDVELSLRPIGGIFARLDSSGNLTFYDAVANVLGTFSQGSYSASLNKINIFGAYSTASLDSTMTNTGIGVSFTTKVSGKAFVIMSGIGSSNTGGDGFHIQTRFFANISVPASGTTTPTGLGLLDMAFPASGTTVTSFSQFAFATVVAGTPYALWLALGAVTGGTASISQAGISVIEA